MELKMWKLHIEFGHFFRVSMQTAACHVRMDVNNSLSLLSRRHIEHSPEWIVIGTSGHRGLLCLACAVELLEDSDVPNMKKKFLLGEMSSSFKDSGEVMIEFLINHEKFTWYLVDILFDTVQQNNKHLTDAASDVLLHVCCQLQADELVYGLLQKIINKIEASNDSQQCLSVLSLMNKMIDAIPALTQTLMEDNSGLLYFLTHELSSPDEAMSCLAISVLNSLLGSAPQGSPSTPIISEVCRGLFGVITAAHSQKIIHSAVGLLKTLSEVPEYVPIIVDTAFTTGQQTLPIVIKKVLHTRKDKLQICAVQIIGQLLSKSQNVQELAEKLLDADMAEFLVEQLSTTNKVLLSCGTHYSVMKCHAELWVMSHSIFCSLLLLTESDTFFSKCHSVLGIDPILRATEQCLAMNYFDALLYGLQLLCVIFEKHPDDQKLMSGGDIFKHATILLSRCVQLSDSKLMLLGMKSLQTLFRKDYLPVPIDLSTLTLPVNAVVGVISHFPRPLLRGMKKHLAQRSQADVRHGTNTKLAKQEEAILGCVQLIEKAFSLALAITEDTSMYDESQFSAPSTHDLDGDHHGNSISSFTTHLLGILERDIIPTVMINYEIFSESSAPLFTSFLRTLCHACAMDVTVDFHVKLASSSFIQWALEVKSKFHSESALHLAVDEFIPSLCSKLLSTSSHPTSRSSLKAAMHRSKDAMSLCKLLTEDHDGMNIHGPNNQSDSSITEMQDGCLAILYCAWLHDDRLVSEVTLLEILVFYVVHKTVDKPSDTSLKHLLFLFASVSHSGDIPTQMEGTTTLLRVIGEAHGRTIYTHHQQIIEWCFTCPGVTSQFTSEMLELWIQNISLPDDDSLGEDKDIVFFIKFISSNQKCLSSLLNLFITVTAEEIISKILGVLERTFHHLSGDQPSISEVMTSIFNRLPEMQAKVLLKEDSIQSPGSTELCSFLSLITAVFTHCTEATVIESSDLKLIFYVIKLLGAPESGEPVIVSEKLLVMLNYLTVVLLQSLSSADSRVASVMVSSEPFLKALHQLIMTTKEKRLDVLYTTPKKVRYQSLYITAQLLKACANFKLKPSLLLTLDVNVILKSLMDKDLCVKVISLQLLTVLLDIDFERQLVQLSDETQQRPRPEADVGLGIAAGTIRKVFFILQNMLLQGSDFLAWNCTQCMSSLLKYVNRKNKQLSMHLLHQPWNGFLLQCCLNFCQDSVPSAWLLQLVALFSSDVSPKSLGCLLQTAMQQSDSMRQDHRTVAAILNLISQKHDDISWGQTLTDATRLWSENVIASLQESPETSLMEILHVNDMVISADPSLANEMTAGASMLREAEELLEWVSSSERSL